MKKFCDSHYGEIKFKNDAQRRAHLVRKGVKLQRDESGTEGVCVAANGDDEKQIKVGKRLSATKARQMDLGEPGEYTKAEIADLHEKNASKLKVQANSKDHLVVKRTCLLRLVGIRLVM